MLKIKLARFGKKKQPHYRIVVNEARDKRDGSYVALLGHYAPTQIPKTLDIDLDAYKLWVKKGAQPTETVDSLVKRLESGNPFPERKARPSKKAKAKVAAEAESKLAAEEAAKAATEAPAEETAAAAETASEASEAAATETAEATPEATETPAA
jgi:small subunit ribosomal protein S16